jgi:hypothetical protein
MDEATHIAKFIELSCHVFPSQNHEPLKVELQRNVAMSLGSELRPMSLDDLMMEIVQINIGEVKNRIHLELMKIASLAYANRGSSGAVTLIADRLISDEVRSCLKPSP